ncbi:phage baseplate assembly protein V [Puia dinghuensis]|uniref:Baseplate assembly protein n=1 Tax=Puia dinghuensis TaxID=1792502 RepID=A0A8J2XRE2_9BACT|nr:phage baseplate assembly protein V [Puia dinghuensis]GGA88662.1 baseplate assembly protein [Puia dinghuensis]
MKETGKFFGKYKGTVVFNEDPEFRGRLLLNVPDVYGLIPSPWAEPCTPLAGPTGPEMGVYMVPPIDTPVWVEFEKGDQNKPIWVGCRWGGPQNVPPLALAGLPISPNILMQSAGQNTIMISDLPTPAGGIMLKSTLGATITVNDIAITIQNGKGASIVLTANTVVINEGALTII